MTWKPFSNNREIKTESGFTVIRPVNRPVIVPLFCPICSLMMRTELDSQRWKETGCCHFCSMKWADPDRSKWISGWRPSSDDVRAEIKLRQMVPIGVKLEAV